MQKKELKSLEDRREQLRPIMDNVSKEIKEYGTVKTLLLEAGMLERDIQNEKTLEEKRWMEQMPKGSIHERLAWGMKKTRWRISSVRKINQKIEKWRNKSMEKHIYGEKNGLSYTLHGDYYLPDLVLNEEEVTYGKYGLLRKQFLKEQRLARYQYLLLTGKLTEHLNQIDQEAREQVEILMEQMAEKQGVTEELKEQDQMEWVRLMNNIKASVEEIVMREIIYV